MEKIKEQLEEMEYDYAVAIATQSEIENGAACGSLHLATNTRDPYFNGLDVISCPTHIKKIGCRISASYFT